jgi:hypothetical protein
MNTRRSLLKGLTALLALPAVSLAQARHEVVVYKNRSCGCCGEWEKHMRSSGFVVQSHALDDVGPVKRNLGVPEALASCHTAMVSGYVIEGHVPAGDVARLLRERPKATGLAVPGMPSDAPGMDQHRGLPYQTIAFDARRSWVFTQH